MSFLASAQAIGSLVDPDMIRRAQLTPQHLYGIISEMPEDGARLFEEDLRSFQRDGHVTEFLLGTLAIAGGSRSLRDGRAIVFDLQSNVVGVIFNDAHAEVGS